MDEDEDDKREELFVNPLEVRSRGEIRETRFFEFIPSGPFCSRSSFIDGVIAN